MLEWDAAADRFVASSLHYFEGDAALRGGRRVFARGPKAVTDPQVHNNSNAIYLSYCASGQSLSNFRCTTPRATRRFRVGGASLRAAPQG